jgi:hypothetical protein
LLVSSGNLRQNPFEYMSQTPSGPPAEAAVRRSMRHGMANPIHSKLDPPLARSPIRISARRGQMSDMPDPSTSFAPRPCYDAPPGHKLEGLGRGVTFWVEAGLFNALFFGGLDGVSQKCHI